MQGADRKSCFDLKIRRKKLQNDIIFTGFDCVIVEILQIEVGRFRVFERRDGDIEYG